MQREMLAVIVALALGQAGSGSFAGTWVAELSGNTYVRLELRQEDGAVGGRIALGNIEVDAQGLVRTAGEAPRELTPLLSVVLRGSTLSFARKDGNDTDHFELTLIGNEAELLFLPSEADRKELAENGIAVPKPIKLTRKRL